MSISQTQRVLSLDNIVQYELPALFRRHHLGRDMIAGLIGDRGDGKSIGGAIITLLDYMVEGEPCWSNMRISATFDVNDDIAGKYRLKGGRVQFASQELDKHKFLAFDREYSNGVFFTDEINIWLADARRSMSTQNLLTVDIGQELRKLQSAWVYTCIHEMFVDCRIRDITDVFILTRDTALSPEGLRQKRQLGVDFEWTIYPMTRKLTGERYADTKRTLAPVYLHGKKFWGAIDTYERQVRSKLTVPMGKTMADVEIEENPVVIEARSKWGWLYEKMLALHSQDVNLILDTDLWKYLQLDERGISSIAVGRQLAKMGIQTRTALKGHQYYEIPSFDLTKIKKQDEKVAVMI